MSTPLNSTEELPGAPNAVFALLTDADFLQQRMVAGGGIDPAVISIGPATDADSGNDAAPGSTTVVTRQSIPASILPPMAQSMISGDPVTERTETWRTDGDGYTADLSITVQGAPASLAGTITLTPTSSGATYAIEAQANVPIPMFGPKIEAVIAEQLTTVLAEEAEYTRSRLTD